MLRSFATTAVLLMLSTRAAACPVCDSENGQQVRAQIVDEHLAVSIAAIVVPFALVGGVVALVSIAPPSTRRRR